MPTRPTDRRPRDPSQLGKLMVDIMAGVVPDTISASKKQPGKSKGRAGGLKGGKARARALPKRDRVAIARKGADSRWHPSGA